MGKKVTAARFLKKQEMSFSLVLEGGNKKFLLSVEGEDERGAFLQITPLAFTPWSIIFRDFLRLVYWFPHSDPLARAILNFFQRPFVFPDEVGEETHFKIELEQKGRGFGPNFLVWQPSRSNSSAISIREETSLLFLNVLALGLMHRGESSFIIRAEELEDEQLFQYHGEIRWIEDEFRKTGLSPFWVTADVQRNLAVARAYDLGLPPPSGIPGPLLRYAEDKVMRPWRNEEFESLIRLVADLGQHWSQVYRKSHRESGEAMLALENWIFCLNLLGFVDRFLAGVLPTRLPNPVAPLLSFLLERFFITQWESDLWPARRSALEESYRTLIPFLME